MIQVYCHILYIDTFPKEFFQYIVIIIMDVGQLLGIFAGIFSFSAYVFYIVAIIKGTTKPSRATWFIWAFIGLVLALSYDASGAENTIWVPVSEAIAPTIIALLSIKYGVGGADKIDFLAFVGSVISLILWWIFNSPLIALVSNLAIDFFAALPTVKKSWTTPSDEDRFAWTITSVGNIFNLFAIDKFVFAVIIYPVYTIIIDGIITAELYRPIFKKNNGK